MLRPFFPELVMYGPFEIWTSLGTSIMLLNQFHDLYTELDLHRIMSGFHGAFATGVASQQGTLTLPDTWFRPPFWDLLMLQLLRPNSSNLPCLYSTFHLEYPLVLSRFCFQCKEVFISWKTWSLRHFKSTFFNLSLGICEKKQDIFPVNGVPFDVSCKAEY